MNLREMMDRSREDGLTRELALARVCQDIPFEITAPVDPFYSDSNKARLRESEQQFLEGRTVIKTMEELETMASQLAQDAKIDQAIFEAETEVDLGSEPIELNTTKEKLEKKYYG